MAEQKILTYLDTSLGKFIFDAYFNVNHNSTLSITEHPIQTGADVSDHAFMEGENPTFEIGMSDVMQDISDSRFAKFTGDNSRSVNAYQILKQLQSQRIPIQFVTRLWTYNNMLIENIVAPDDDKTTYGLRATITLKEIFVANVETVKVSERPHKSVETNEGDQKPQQASQSILSQLLG
jgi:hypothetical protein